MADHIDTEVLACHFTSLPSSPAYRTEVNGNGECGIFQDTVPLDDAMVLDSPLLETPFEKLDDETQAVDSGDCVEDERLEQAFEFEEEVVDDSEDEDGGMGRVSVADAVKLQESSAGIAHLLLESDASNDQECQTGKQGSTCDTVSGNEGNDPLEIVADDHGPRLDFVESQEPGESTQANALDFVDHFLMDKDLNLSPGVNLGNILRMKSPPVSGAKGPQSLAKRIRTRTPTRERRIFDWIDNDQREARDAVDTCSNTCFKSREDHIAVNDIAVKKGSVDLFEDTKALTHPVSSFVKNGIGEHCKTEQVSEISEENTFIAQLDVQLQDEVSREELETEEDLLDIGINTQIAAEVMGALSYAAHACCGTRNAKESQQNACESGPCSFQQNLSYHVGGSAVNSNEEQLTSKRCNRENLVSSAKSTGHLELVPGLATSREVERRTKSKRRRSWTSGKMIGRNFSHAAKIPSRSSRKLIEHRSEKVPDGKSSREFEIHQNLLIQAEVGSLGKTLPKGKHFANQTTQSIPGSISEITRDKISDLSEGNSNMMENRSQMHNRSGRAIAPSEMWNSNWKTKFIQKEKTDIKVAEIKIFLNLDEWKHPRGKRSRLMQRLNVSESKPCGVSSVAVESKSSSVSAGCENSNGQVTITAILPVELEDMVSSASGPGVTLSKRRQTSCSQSNVTDQQINISNLASPRKIYGGGYHKSPCNKGFPKSSLLKELTRLGGPGKVTDFMWKDLRRRRNLAYFRVLFSQHLDNDTIKQQKKIAARLGISLAFSSADATHFIADRFARTKNMLEAMAFGKPVVTHLWLESCGQARCLIDEKGYILRDSKKEKEIGFCMPTSLARANQNPLLKGMKVFITPNIKPDREMIAGLVKLVHGEVVEITPTHAAENRRVPDDLLIISCEEDREICLPFVMQGAAIYTPELLLNGIVIQKLEYARHLLFANADTIDQRNTKPPTTHRLLSAH